MVYLNHKEIETMETKEKIKLDEQFAIEIYEWAAAFMSNYQAGLRKHGLPPGKPYLRLRRIFDKLKWRNAQRVDVQEK